MLRGSSVSAVVFTPKAGGQRGKAGRKINKILVERELLSACVLPCSPVRISQPRNNLFVVCQAECRDITASGSPSHSFFVFSIIP